MAAPWEYQIVEEANPISLQDRLTALSESGWEAVGLGYAGDNRLLALVKRSARSVTHRSDVEAMPVGSTNG